MNRAEPALRYQTGCPCRSPRSFGITINQDELRNRIEDVNLSNDLHDSARIGLPAMGGPL